MNEIVENGMLGANFLIWSLLVNPEKASIAWVSTLLRNGWTAFLKCGKKGSVKKAKGLENIQNLGLDTGFPYMGISWPNLKKGE